MKIAWRSVGTLLVVLTFAAGAHAMEETDHSAHGTAEMAGHDHDQLVELPEGVPTPTVAVRLSEDAVGGWNLFVDTAHFQFAPEDVNGAHRPGHGHAHLYINNVKTARLYGPWYHIGQLPPGANTIRVTLNTNQHATYAASGQPIAAEAIVKAPDLDVTAHDDR